MLNQIIELHKQVQNKTPLVHQITNYVTVNDCANATLAIGGSPVMADDRNEVEDMVGIASALVINMGTLNERTVESMIMAGKRANELGVPVVFDPVGAGATPYRTKVAQMILKEVQIQVVRGNRSEIQTICGLQGQTKGVDANHSDDSTVAEDINFFKDKAKELPFILAITGAEDIITDGQSTVAIQNGDAQMSKITGTGCMCSAIMGAYIGVSERPFIGTVAAVLAMGIAGEVAAQKARDKGEGTSSLRTYLIDMLSLMDEALFLERGKLIEKEG